MKQVTKYIFNTPKIALVSLLLLWFFMLETIFMALYLIVESPIRYILDKLELYIRYLTKQIN